MVIEGGTGLMLLGLAIFAFLGLAAAAWPWVCKWFPDVE